MQAITYLVNNRVDLILLDYEMPIVDGPQVLEMLRSESATKDIPVIFLTGVGTRESVTRVMALKPSGYILKTTTREDLRNKLKEFFAS
jgi:CheY-like chemotaxis protein